MNIAELDSFNLSDTVKFHDRLNPRLWDRNEHLHPEVRDKLLEIAADFQTFLGVPDLDVKDITVSGSNAAYNYTNHSDIDLHLVVDLPEADQNEVFRELFDAKKYQYNDQHNIKIAGYNVELYVQDPNKPHHSQGIYSLLKNAWVRVPTRRKPEINDISVASKVEDLGARIEDVIESGDYDRIRNLFDKLKRMRQAGLDQQGEFGSDNLAYKVLRNMGLIQQLVDARNQAKDQALSLTERKKKKRRVKYGFGGWFYPGYSFDTGSDSSADGGGGDGGGESIAENSAEKTQHLVMKFIDQAAQKLGIESMPRIELHLDPAWSETEHSFGRYTPETHTLEVNLAGRHIMDILRTTAHELAHCRQHQESPLPDHAGETGSPWENEAHAVAGVIMRDFADANPGLFESSGYIPTEAERNDPRFEMALTQDVRPGEIGRQANKMALKTDSQGRPGLLMKTANLVQEGRMPQPSKGQGRYRDLNEPLGPEFKPTMPAGTVRVDVSDMYDWYKLGQHISNMKGLGRHDFGAGPPSTIFSFGDEDLEHQYIDALKKTGLDTTDIDPAAHDPKSGQKTDPTYNVDETVDDSFGRRQAQKGRTPYYKNPDIEVPVHKLPSGKTEQFAQFEVEPARGTVAHIVGITRGGDRVRISTTTADLAAALVDAYNRHGFSDKYIQRVPLSAIEPQPEPPRPPGLKRIKEAWLVTDVPNEDWLASKQASAKESGKNRYGVPAMGSTTAYVRNPSYIELPVSLLARIPGARGEQQNVRYNDLAAITKIMKDTGQLPLHNGKPYMPFIAVAYDGSAWTMEGNHRIMAAKDLGWKTLPVELKYFDGGERVESGPLYPGKIGLNPPPPGSVVRMNEGAVSYTDPNQLVDLYLRTRNKKNFAQVTVQRVFKDLPYKQIDRAVELLTKKYNVPPSEISWAPSKKSVSESNNNPQVDLTPNYPNYEQLVGEFQGINKNQRAVFRIITAALRPGAGATEKIEKAFANGTLVSMELSRIKNRQVIEASLGVAEAFDRPYPLKWEKSEYGDYDALARLDDGTYLSISFEHVTPYEVAVSFWRNNSQAVTGEGDAQRVFATVLKAVQKFLKIEQPANISFSAVKEDDPSGSRSKLYSKLVQRYGANWGYQARSFEHDDKVEFELTKIRQNVDEVFNTQPSKSATWARPIGQWDEIDEFNFVASNGVAYQVDFLAPVAGPDELDPYTFFEPEEEISDQAYDSAKFVSFEQKSDGENTVGKQGIEGTGVAAEVFGIVTNVMLQYIKKAKPSMLYFQAAEPNRQRLYARMAARLAQTIQWKVKQDGPAHFAIYNPRVIKVVPSDQGVAENFADGKVKGKSRPGRVKRAGASCSGSVTDLRARAKKYGGERGKMYHWCANMKSGRSKTNESADTIYYHGGNTAITQPRVPAHGMYFSPHREWAEEYGPVITQARVINPRIYLVDYDEDIDDDIVEALFDRDYAKVGEYIKMLAQQGYTALQTVTDSEMLVVFPGSRIEIIGVEK